MPSLAYRLTAALALTALLWLPVLSTPPAAPRPFAASGAAALV